MSGEARHWLVTVCMCVTAASLVLSCLYLWSGLRLLDGKAKTWWERLIRSPRDER